MKADPIGTDAPQPPGYGQTKKPLSATNLTMEARHGPTAQIMSRSDGVITAKNND